MKLVVVCFQYHACILVPEDNLEAAQANAKESIEATIKAGGLPPSDTLLLEPQHERDLPFDWKTQEPYTSANLTDEQFAGYAQTGDGQNLTTLEVFKSLYEK